ncbi:hypothetical protein ACG93R_22215 [Acinetobacter guillouiae]|uniref:hypothetical protein n=1 Tax=Acinetobacter guillouiae TaxID=106649 RepID=UPI003AF4C78C
MAIHVKEIHQKQINAHLSDAETKQAILEYVLRQHDVGDAEYKHRTFITSNLHSTGNSYEGRCEITIDLGGGDETSKTTDQAADNHTEAT